jgi:hypothetical protein
MACHINDSSIGSTILHINIELDARRRMVLHRGATSRLFITIATTVATFIRVWAHESVGPRAPNQYPNMRRQAIITGPNWRSERFYISLIVLRAQTWACLRSSIWSRSDYSVSSRNTSRSSPPLRAALGDPLRQQMRELHNSAAIPDL